MDKILSANQIKKAKEWMREHLSHINEITLGVREGYPPSLSYDKNNPYIWKPEHWVWFIRDRHLKK